MPLSDYLVGLVFWAGTIGFALWAAWIVLTRRLPRLTGAAKAAAGGVLGMAAVAGVHLVPGIIGVLSRGTALVAAVLLALAASRLERLPGTPEREPRTSGSPERSISTAFAAIAAGVLGLAYLTQAWAASAKPADAIDPLTHHLPNVAAWVRSGSFWQIDQFVPLLANGNYPHTGDVLFLSAVLPWSNDAFVRPLNLAWVALLGVCVYALCRELGAPRSSSVLFTAVLGSMPVTVLAASYGAMTDLPMLAALAAGLLFLARHFRTRDATLRMATASAWPACGGWTRSLPSCPPTASGSAITSSTWARPWTASCANTPRARAGRPRCGLRASTCCWWAAVAMAARTVPCQDRRPMTTPGPGPRASRRSLAAAT